VIGDTARNYEKVCAGLPHPHPCKSSELSHDLDLIVKSLA
jgi:hypothetical protein